MMDRAAIFVDGRYTLGCKTRANTVSFVPEHLADRRPTDGCRECAKEAEKIGFDHLGAYAGRIDRLRIACKGGRAELVPMNANPGRLPGAGPTATAFGTHNALHGEFAGQGFAA